MTQDTSLVAFEPQNISQIAQLGPAAAADNRRSRDLCLQAGQALLDTVEAEGMSDALDQQIATYLNKARNTVRRMNERRTPVTRLFDTIRTHFTSLENDVDPSRKDTIPARLQDCRNRYAARKREEEERRRLEFMRQQQHSQALARYTTDVEQDYRQQFNTFMVTLVNSMVEIDRNVTLDTIDQAEATLKSYSEKMPDEQAVTFRCGVRMPLELTIDEARAIRQSVLARLRPQFEEQYTFEVTTNRDDILDRLPSKRTQLERAAKASAEEAERIKREMAEREAAEAARRQQERREREEKERAEAELAAKKQEMDGLFGAAQAGLQTYQPKTQVRLRIEVLRPEGFMEVLGMWWSQKGCTLSVEELSKEFKKQITFCTQLANDKTNPLQIKSENLTYVEDIKAK